MKKRLQAASLTLAIAMGFTSLAGCGNTQNQPQTGGTTAPAQQNSNDTGAKQADDTKMPTTPITFTMYNAETNPVDDAWQSPVAKKITELTGVTLQIEFAVGDPKQKLSLMAASGDYPDLVFAKGDLNVLKNVNAIIPLDDLIDQYGENVKTMYGDQLTRLRWSLEDPQIYNLGSSSVGNVPYEPTSGFGLQHAVVKELGYPKMRILKDFEDAIRQYKEKYPTIDGQPTIGLALDTDDWRNYISLTNPAAFATGKPDDGEWYINQETLEATRHLTTPEEREYFRWLNHMYNTGLLDPETFVHKHDQYMAKLSSGRVLGIADARWSFNEAQTALRQVGKEERMYGQYPLTLDETYKYAEFQDMGYDGGWGVAITTKAKDPVRVFQFLDWIASEEAQILVNWGIEGEHYTIENGKRVEVPKIREERLADPNFRKKTGIGNYSYPFPTYGNAVVDSTGNYYRVASFEEILASQTSVENEVLAKYGAKMWKDLYPSKDDFPVKPYGAAYLMSIDDPDYAAADKRIVDIGWKRIPQAILAKPEEFDSIYDTFLQEIEAAGLKSVEAQFTEKVKQKVELWN